MGKIRIGDRVIGEGNPPFIVAEIGINHNGFVEKACEMVRRAKLAGCDAVKFQTRTVDVVYSEKEQAVPRNVPPQFGILQNAARRGALKPEAVERLQKTNFGEITTSDVAMTNGDLKHALEFSREEYTAIIKSCIQNDMLWFTSPWDVESVDRIGIFNPPIWKIASACLTDRELLKRVRKTGKPVILSTGASTMDQIKTAVEILGRDCLLLMHTVSVYPVPDSKLNLRLIHTLQKEFPDVPIGYSGHEHGILPSAAAVLLGAVMIERHFTLDRRDWGSDQAASLEPYDTELLVDLCASAAERRSQVVPTGTEMSDVIADVLLDVGIRYSPDQLRRLCTDPNESIPSAVRRLVRDVLGDGVKRIDPKEVEVMKKLRRVTDY